jgi:hypothetical protein
MFRTDVLNPGRRKFLEKPRATSDYASTIAIYRDRLNSADGNQPGDPRLAAERIVDLARGEGWFGGDGREVPFRVFLGSDCFETVRAKCLATLEALDGNRDLAFSTDYEVEM